MRNTVGQLGGAVVLRESLRLRHLLRLSVN